MKSPARSGIGGAAREEGGEGGGGDGGRLEDEGRG